MNIHICFSSSNEYSRHMGVAIISVLYHAREQDYYHFHVLDGGISQQNRDRLASIVQGRGEIHYIPISPEDFKDCPMSGYVDYITLQTYYRLRLPSYLPDVEKILYLDSDLIVNHDVSPLYEMELGDYYMAGVPEVFQQHHVVRLDYRPNEWYCNAGVLLINNRKWKEDNIEEKLFSYVAKPEREIVYLDQDVMNEVLKYRILYLPLCWNLQHVAIFYPNSYPWHEAQHEEALRAPRIIHFTDKRKPWFAECENPWAYLYRKHLAASPWQSEYEALMRRVRLRRLLRCFWSYGLESEGNLVSRLFGIPLFREQGTRTEKITRLLGGLFSKRRAYDYKYSEMRCCGIRLISKKRPENAGGGGRRELFLFGITLYVKSWKRR